MVEKNKRSLIYTYVFIAFIFFLAFGLIHLYYPAFQHWFVFIAYVFFSNSFVAIPHEPLMIYYGKEYGVWMPVLFAVIPTAGGCILDYIVLRPLLKSRYLHRPMNSTMMTKAIRYFRRFPFSTLLVFAVSPLPFYPVRILSVASEYSALGYTSAVTIGRIPRYLILAYGGYKLKLSNEFIIALFAAFIAIPVLLKLIQKGKRRIFLTKSKSNANGLYDRL